MIDELNKEAFELINLVVFKPKEVPKERTELVGSSKERGVRKIDVNAPVNR